MTQPQSEHQPGLLQQFQLALYASKIEPPLHACDLAVLLELIDRYKKPVRHKKGGGVTYPSSAAHLARETGRDERSVQRSLDKLQSRGLIAIAVPGRGSRGNTYELAFGWVAEVAADIEQEIARRTKAKKSRRGRNKASYGAHAVGASDMLATAPTPSLRDLVTARTPYINNLATASTPPQTYGGPTDSLRRCETAPAHAEATQGGSPLKKKIIDARAETENGETWLALELMEDDGTCDDAYVLLESHDHKSQAEGQRDLEKLRVALDIGEIDDAADLIGHSVMVTSHGDFLPVPANDDQPAGAFEQPTA